jgi:adenylosuccinate lyase
MIPRYQTEFMRKTFSDEHKFYTWFLVEIAYLESYLSHHKNDEPLIKRLKEKSKTIDWGRFVEKVLVHEEKVHHDVIAFLHALEDELHEDARLIHMGLTSSDVVDTAFSMLLAQSGEEILLKVKMLIKALYEKALNNQNTLCLGRTHGQGAEATTIAIKLLGHAFEIHRSYERLAQAFKEIAFGKFSGAVGVYGHTKPEVEALALKYLGLKVEPLSTQVIPRDRHAALFSNIAVLAGSLERLATEIRLLMHGEVGEVKEGFKAGQKGSSAMPHKKNPILSENICGLMRILRSSAIVALENQALWHERDISHSSAERIIAPDVMNVLDFALGRMINVIKDLVIEKEQMKENLSVYQASLKSQSILLALVKQGLMRQKAYELVQLAVMKEGSFKENLQALGVLEHLSKKEFDEIFNEIDAPKESLFFSRAKEAFSGLL